jgi:hypothetical protein
MQKWGTTCFKDKFPQAVLTDPEEQSMIEPTLAVQRFLFSNQGSLFSYRVFVAVIEFRVWFRHLEVSLSIDSMNACRQRGWGEISVFRRRSENVPSLLFVLHFPYNMYVRTTYLSSVVFTDWTVQYDDLLR